MACTKSPCILSINILRRSWKTTECRYAASDAMSETWGHGINTLTPDHGLENNHFKSSTTCNEWLRIVSCPSKRKRARKGFFSNRRGNQSLSSAHILWNGISVSWYHCGRISDDRTEQVSIIPFIRQRFSKVNYNFLEALEVMILGKHVINSLSKVRAHLSVLCQVICYMISTITYIREKWW